MLIRQATKTSGRGDADIRQALETVGSGRRRRALLESHIREQVRQVLRLSIFPRGFAQAVQDSGS